MLANASQTLFAHVVNRPDDQLELDVAALLIGDWEQRELDVASYLQMLDRLAAAAAENMEDDEPLSAITSLNRVLFQEHGFRGNQDDYYDPQNSFLSSVLDRKTGIPITLSVVYIEVARRLGLPVKGVGFPGHFLVRYDLDDSAMLVIDPFRMGMMLDQEALQAILESITGKSTPLTPSLLAAASNRDILIRMLNNLAAIYRRKGDTQGSIEVLQRLLILDPSLHQIEAELTRLRHRPSEVN